MKNKTLAVLVVLCVVIGTINAIINATCPRDFGNGVICCAAVVVAIAWVLEDFK